MVSDKWSVTRTKEHACRDYLHYSMRSGHLPTIAFLSLTLPPRPDVLFHLLSDMSIVGPVCHGICHGMVQASHQAAQDDAASRAPLLHTSESDHLLGVCEGSGLLCADPSFLTSSFSL